MSEALQAVIDDLSQKLGSAMQAKKNLDSIIETVGAIQSAVTDAASNAAVIAVPAAAAVVDFHLNKTAGSYGSYGISSQLAQLETMRSAKEAEITFCELAIGIYNCLNKGLAIPSDLAFPPGYDQEAGILYSVDMDHPGSRRMFESGPDIHLQNRPYDTDLPLNFIFPEAEQLGDIICLDGIQFIFTDTGWYPVGIQEPVGVCDTYGVNHTGCVPEGGM